MSPCVIIMDAMRGTSADGVPAVICIAVLLDRSDEVI